MKVDEWIVIWSIICYVIALIFCIIATYWISDINLTIKIMYASIFILLTSIFLMLFLICIYIIYSIYNIMKLILEVVK